MSADDRHGVIDSSKTYNQHSLARILGVASPKWVVQNLIQLGVPHRKVGQNYLISGHEFHLWVQQGSHVWENSKSSDDAGEPT